jgi:hypothetical protein
LAKSERDALMSQRLVVDAGSAKHRA